TLGVHIVGPHATDLIAEASVALELEATPGEIGGSTHPHPTLSEVLGEAALAGGGRSHDFSTARRRDERHRPGADGPGGPHRGGPRPDRRRPARDVSDGR